MSPCDESCWGGGSEGKGTVKWDLMPSKVQVNHQIFLVLSTLLCNLSARRKSPLAIAAGPKLMAFSTSYIFVCWLQSSIAPNNFLLSTREKWTFTHEEEVNGLSSCFSFILLDLYVVSKRDCLACLSLHGVHCLCTWEVHFLYRYLSPTVLPGS